MIAGIISVDVHGMNCYQAKVKIDSLLRRSDSGVYRLRIIHGFHQGTAIKEMIWQEYATHPKVKEILSGNNTGQTELVLRAF